MIHPLVASCLLSLALFPFAASAQPGDPPQTLVVRVSTRDAAVIAELARRHSHLLVAKEKGIVVFDSDADELNELQASGLSVEVDLAATAAQQASSLRSPGRIDGIPGFPCYRTVAETNARYDALLSQYPQLVQVADIGDSWERASGGALVGEDMRVIRLTNTAITGPKPKVFLMTGIHAREYTPAELSLRLVEWLLAGHGSNADATWMLDHQELQVLVHSNPDGRKRAETGSSWRKNTNATYCPATRRGADLNRNYPFEWGAHNGSSGSACDDTFRGPMRASEPETQAVVDFVRTQFADRRGPLATDAAPADTSGLFLDLHSYSRLVLWPWGYTQGTAPNSSPLETLGRRFAWFNGYAPQQSVDLYVTDGTTVDFAYGELGVAAFTFELGNQFFESCAAFEAAVFPDNLDALLYALRSARAPYLLPAGPEAREVAISPDLALAGETLTVTAVLDDSRFNQADGGNEALHGVSGANAYVSIPPWQPGSIARPASAVDGAFNSPIESVNATIAGDASTVGRHLVFVQGQDASGSTGPVGSAFADVRAPADIGTVSGRVRDAVTLAPIAATISASGYLSRTDVQGAYARRLPTGSHTVIVAAQDYEAVERAAVNVAGGVSTTLDFELIPLCEVLFEDAAGVAAGWTQQAPWGFANANAAHASRHFSDSPAGNYANGANTSLTSPAFDLRGFDSPVLQFESRCDTEAGFDYGIVEVRSSPAGSWIEVFRCDGDPAWRQVRIDDVPFADAAMAQLRFRFTSDGGVTDEGWSVDEIVVKAGGAACRSQSTGTLFANGFE